MENASWRSFQLATSSSGSSPSRNKRSRTWKAISARATRPRGSHGRLLSASRNEGILGLGADAANRHTVGLEELPDRGFPGKLGPLRDAALLHPAPHNGIKECAVQAAHDLEDVFRID